MNLQEFTTAILTIKVSADKNDDLVYVTIVAEKSTGKMGLYGHGDGAELATALCSLMEQNDEVYNVFKAAVTEATATKARKKSSFFSKRTTH